MEKTCKTDLKIVKNRSSSLSARNINLTTSKQQKNKLKVEYMVARASVNISSNSNNEKRVNSLLFFQNSNAPFEVKKKVIASGSLNMI